MVQLRKTRPGCEPKGKLQYQRCCNHRQSSIFFRSSAYLVPPIGVWIHLGSDRVGACPRSLDLQIYGKSRLGQTWGPPLPFGTLAIAGCGSAVWGLWVIAAQFFLPSKSESRPTPKAQWVRHWGHQGR